MRTLPTFLQIDHVRSLLRSELYDIPVVVRLTGVSLRDVFRIEKAMMKEKNRNSKKTFRQETQKGLA